MTDTTPSTRLRRRELLAAGGGLAAGLLVPAWRASAAPAFVRSRPVLTHGVQTGDVTRRTAIVWARADRPSRMVVRARRQAHRGPGAHAGHRSHGQGAPRGLTPGGEVGVEVLLENLDDASVTSEPLEATFTTAPKDARDISFVWSGDLVGQGWGINPDVGGLRIFGAMRRPRPDFFLNSGDTVLRRRSARADGRAARRDHLDATWSRPEKSKVAETLAEFRGQYALQPAATRRYAPSPPRCPRSTSGTTTRSSTTGTRARSSTTPATPRSASTSWRRARTGRSSSGCRSRGADRGPCTAGSPTGRCWTSSSWTCARTRTPTTANVHADPHRGLLGAEQLAWLKPGLRGSQGHVEGDRHRPAARAGRAGRRRRPGGRRAGRPGRAARPRAAVRRICCASRTRQA